MPILQKPLGWAQRFLYNVEQGPLPSPQLVLPIDQDWPLEQKMVRADGNTAAGGLTTLTIAPGQEKHALVTHLLQNGDIATPFPATDNVFARMTQPNGLVMDIARTGGSAVNYFPLVGCALNGSSLQWFGIDPVYVPPGWTLEILHVSVAGGIFYESVAIYLERLKSYPLRLP